FPTEQLARPRDRETENRATNGLLVFLDNAASPTQNLAMTDQKGPTAILANVDTMLPELEAIYKDMHAHPELSMHETRTAKIAANHLKTNGFEVTTGVGQTGVVGILRNGIGPTVML